MINIESLEQISVALSKAYDANYELIKLANKQKRYDLDFEQLHKDCLLLENHINKGNIALKEVIKRINSLNSRREWWQNN